jgi:hypothetical protein
VHYIVNVFVAPGDSLEAALKPFNEEIPIEDENGAWYGQRHWDWWVEGGRWEGYFDGENVTTAAKLAPGKVKGSFEVPYAFVTLPSMEKYPNVSRMWHARKIYLPVGFYENRPYGWGDNAGKDYWTLNHFFEVPHYEKHFNDYLRKVPEDTLVYAVDVHQ